MKNVPAEIRAQIERQCRYITDDGTIAGYHGIPRVIVARIRSRLRPPRVNNLVLCPRSGSTGPDEMIRRKSEAEIANERHVRALLQYGAKHGLPNIAPEVCAARLAG